MLPLIRPLWLEDIEAVLAIEFSSYPFPWTEGIFRECLRSAYGCYGLQLDDALAGYSIYNWAAGESHLLNLCIDPQYRRQGFGRMLLEHSIAHARAQRCSVMFLEVRPSNEDATNLYQRRGFQTVGQRPAYYQAEQGREDAVVMRLDLDSED